jgi:FAD/FMN-containing dehydrogenase
MDALDRAALDALRGILGPAGLRTEDVAGTLDPGLDAHNLDAGVVAFPATTAEVAAVVRLCAGRGIAVVPQGGRTGLAGGARSRPGELILATARLDRILEIEPGSATALAEAGVTLGALARAAAAHGLEPGIDLAARDSATLGGMVSTNAGGIEAFRHGTMRHRVLGLEAVLPSGEVVSDLKRVVKANEGYDVKQLLVGAEGTLGIVTRVALQLVPLRTDRATALVAARDAAGAVAVVRRLRAARDSTLLAAEIMWPGYARVTARSLRQEGVLAFAPEDALFLLAEVAGEEAEERLATHLGSAVEAGEAIDAVIAKNAEERRRFWLIREESWEVDKALPHGFWFDVSVPPARLDAYARGAVARVTALDPTLRVFMMGHLGDGNMHVTVTCGRPRPELADAVADAVFAGLAEAGGSFSAEHGIGTEKRAYLAARADPAKLALMRVLKHAIDPRGIMNPGKVV